MAAPALVDSAAPTQGTTGAANTFTFSATLTAGANYLVVFPCWVDSTSQTVSGITYNGVALTECPSSEVLNDATAVSRGIMGCAIWGLANPLTGSAADVVITMDGGQPTRMLPGYGSFSGVDTASPFGTATTGTDEATGTSFALSPATTTDELAIGVMIASSNGVADISGSNTLIFENNEQNSFGTGSLGQYEVHSAGVSTTLTWTKGATRQAAGSAVALKPSGGGGGGDVNRIRFPAQFSAMGVGGMLGGNRVN